MLLSLGFLINFKHEYINIFLFQTLSACARYHPPDGSYSWDDPGTLMRKSASSEKSANDGENKQQKQPDVCIATNPYQVHRTDCLLSEWANRVPLPVPSATSSAI